MKKKSSKTKGVETPAKKERAEPPNFKEGVKLDDHTRVAVLLFVDDGRTPKGDKGRADWGDNPIERRRLLVANVCFEGDTDRADDAIQRLKYLGMIDDDAPCNCSKCQMAKAETDGVKQSPFPPDMPPELVAFAEGLMNQDVPTPFTGLDTMAQNMESIIPKHGKAQMGCAYCGEMWVVDLSKGEKEIQRRAEEHGRKCNKSPLLAELRQGAALRAALMAISETPEYLEASNALKQIKKLATDVLAMLPPREKPPEITG